MPADVTRALATPTDSELIFRTDVRPYLYFASVGLLAIGVLFVGYYLATPGMGVMGVLVAGGGVFAVYAAWVNFWATRGGYPHLILRGHRLIVRSSDAFRRDLDLDALGETRIVILTGDKGSQRLYLGFLPSPGVVLRPRRFVAPRLQQFAGTVLLNGYVGNNVMRAKDIERVVNARREQPAGTVASASARLRPARVRLITTAAVFAAMWVAIVWWRLLP